MLLNQVSTLVFTSQDDLFEAYYFKCNQYFVEIYLSRVSVNFCEYRFIIHRSTQREYSSKPLTTVDIGIFLSPKNVSSVQIS